MAQPPATPTHDRLREPHTKLGALETRTVHGKTITVGERRLTPVVRITSLAQRRGMVGTRYFAGWGVGAVQLRPLAVLEKTPTGTRRIPIRDRTQEILLTLLAVALALPLLLALLVRLVERGRK
ncbi:MAG: hypothetical protein H5T62_07000 [Anaerolineae bacterium]|nr:hypothetical protein [Anaerolineae bacterium]